MSTGYDLVDRYFSALTTKDWAAMRTVLHDEVTFKGPLGETSGADEYIESLQKVMASMSKIRRLTLFGEGNQVCQVYDLVLSEPDVTLPCCQWIQIRDDLIASVRLFFDPRPLVQPPSS